MTELLDKARADETPCLLGTASKDGHPRISPKGSVAVFDPQTLCFWERSGRGALANLKENPLVVVYYRNTARAKENSARGRCNSVLRKRARDRRSIASREGLGPDRTNRKGIRSGQEGDRGLDRRRSHRGTVRERHHES